MAFIGMTKIVTYAIVYPSIALFNAAAFVLHYLSITFVMLLGSAYYLAYPLQQLVTSIITTFTSPLYVLASLIRYTQPLWNLAASLISTSAALGTAFAFLSRKSDARIHAAHAQRLERERVQMLEREVARARQRADEQERRARLGEQRAMAAAAAATATAERYPPHHRHPPSQSLLSAFVDKLCGRVSPQEEYAAYVADLELLETRDRWQNPYGGGIGSGDEDDVAYASPGRRLMIAPPDVNPKRRHGRRASASRFTLVGHQQATHPHHHASRAPVRHAQERGRDAYIPNLHHHAADDALPPLHTPPVDGLPPTPGRSIQSFAPSTSVPSVNLVRARRVGSGKRIMWEDPIAREVEEPVEGEVFGMSDDVEEEDAERALQMHDDERSPSGPSSLHIHFHNNPSASLRRNRTLRFDGSGLDPSGEIIVDRAQLGHKDGTPFKRSSARAARGASGGEEGEAGKGSAFREGRASGSDVEL